MWKQMQAIKYVGQCEGTTWVSQVAQTVSSSQTVYCRSNTHQQAWDWAMACMVLVLKVSSPVCTRWLGQCGTSSSTLGMSSSWIPDFSLSACPSSDLVLEQTFPQSRAGARSKAIMQSISGTVRPGIQPCVVSEAVQVHLELLAQDQKSLRK